MPGLDLVLGGGIPRGGMLFLVGAPGAGKTILSMQIAFHVARSGRPVLFLTALSEPHNKLLDHMRSLAFFSPDLIGNGIELLNLRSLMVPNADESVDSIVSAARKSRTALVIIDGFGGVGDMLNPGPATAQFLYDLGAKLSLIGVTLILGSQADPRQTARYPEFTAADGLVGLYYERGEVMHRRYLEVLKLRGTAHLGGLHSFTISSDGASCYPQQEALAVDPAPRFGIERDGFDLPELDAMLGGGLNEGTATVLAGSPGTGKTLACLHFLAAGVERDQPGLLLGLQESEAQLLAKGAGFGLDLAGAVASGKLGIITHPPVCLDPDIVIHQLKARVEASGVRRLVIDSSRELERALDPARAPDFLAAVVAYLRARGITAVLTREIPKIVGAELDFSDTAAAVLAENVILFRHVEYRAELHRVLSVLKMRFSDHDRSLREFAITERGIAVLDRFASGEGILTGIARRLASEDP